MLRCKVALVNGWIAVPMGRTNNRSDQEGQGVSRWEADLNLQRGQVRGLKGQEKENISVLYMISC